MTWIEKSGDKTHALRFAVYSKRGWSEAKTVVEGERLLVNWADFPSLVAMPDGTLASHWLVKSGPEGHAYDVHIARSTDGGKSWSKAVVPHRDGTKTDHGFVSMLPWSAGRVAAVWLDGRNFKQGSHESPESSINEMTLRSAMIDPKGLVTEEDLLDSRVCDCCQTSAALTSEGAIVVYRDRSEKEIRDISVVRFTKGRWTEPKMLSADGWEIHGCPVNGPSVSADGKRVAVAWFTAAGDTPRVKVVFSNDAGATFGQPIQADEATTVGRVDVLMMADGTAFVSWLERTARGGEVKVRQISPNGSRGKAIAVAESSAARVSGFPQMARAGNEVIFAWTDPSNPSRVRTAVGNVVSSR
ncbi:MAG: sialidase family protein [Blastocatellia bacterium]